jgi:hypothetical protein
MYNDIFDSIIKLKRLTEGIYLIKYEISHCLDNICVVRYAIDREVKGLQSKIFDQLKAQRIFTILDHNINKSHQNIESFFAQCIELYSLADLINNVRFFGYEFA